MYCIVTVMRFVIILIKFYVCMYVCMYSTFHTNYVDLNKFKLYMDGKEIQRVESCKYLGILIDSDLKWRHHIDYVYSKLVKFISIFYKIRIKLAPEILRSLFNWWSRL